MRKKRLQRLFCWAVAVLSSAFGPTGAAHADDHDVVINEIMYHPPGDRDDLQFIELFNRGRTDVDLSKWAFSKGVKFTLPDGTKLGAGGYLVVSRNPSAFTGHYGGNAKVLGPITGKLSHKNERIELADAHGRLIDGVKYADSGAWPLGADGYSSSLERICPFADSENPANWAASTWPATKRAAGTPGRQNENYAKVLPPVVADVAFLPKLPEPGQVVKVTAAVSDSGGVKDVTLLYRVAASGREGEERAVPMHRTAGDEKSGMYEASIEGHNQGQLVRFRIRATASEGAERLVPGTNEPRPTFSYFTFRKGTKGTIPQAYVVNVGAIEHGPGHYQRVPARNNRTPSPLRGRGAMLYVPADSAEPETCDYVQVITRSGGFKVHFQKDRPLKGMTGINIIAEGPVRWLMSEPLSYALYRMAEVPAPLTEHLRLTMDGRLRGLHLLIEQPNKTFLTRNQRDESGNLYKLIWYEQGVVRQHEKKTNPTTGHDDLIQLIEGLRRTSGAEQWAFIEKNFNVPECINYYAVNMCIQNWDGFFNNYFTYHDPGTGKWEIYPWDEDKTWGDYDGASASYDWYEMPLTFGMNGDGPKREFMRFGGGPFGGASWWRPPGYFSGPLLANPEFRRRFLIRLGELCNTVFTETSFLPIIDTMEKRLQPEVRWEESQNNPQYSVGQLRSDMQSFRNQVQNRRKFILNQVAKTR